MFHISLECHPRQIGNHNVAFGWRDSQEFLDDFSATLLPEAICDECAVTARYQSCVRVANSSQQIQTATLAEERLSVHGRGHPAVQAPCQSSSQPSLKRQQALVPWRVSHSTIAVRPSEASAARPLQQCPETKRRKILLLFRLCCEIFLDIGELGFPNLNWEDPVAVGAASDLVLRAALRLSEARIGMLAATLRRWCKWCLQQRVSASEPAHAELARFLEEVSRGGPTAASSVYQALLWLNQNLAARLPLDHFMVRPFRFYALGHVTRQAVELQPWEFISLLRLAAELTGVPQLLLCCILQSAVSCVRCAHAQRSRLVADQCAWLEFECSEGKSRRCGVRPPYRWATPSVVFGDFPVAALARCPFPVACG